MIYDSNDFSDLRPIVNQAIKTLRKHRDEFDIIAVRGVSGITVGSPVALMLDKQLVVIRKPDESSHSAGMPAGIGYNSDGTPHRYIFLDDFIASGATRNAVKQDIALRRPEWRYVGDYLYNYAEPADRWRPVIPRTIW